MARAPLEAVKMRLFGYMGRAELKQPRNNYGLLLIATLHPTTVKSLSDP
jgi:hypothetical protein